MKSLDGNEIEMGTFGTRWPDQVLDRVLRGEPCEDQNDLVSVAAFIADVRETFGAPVTDDQAAGHIGLAAEIARSSPNANGIITSRRERMLTGLLSSALAKVAAIALLLVAAVGGAAQAGVLPDSLQQSVAEIAQAVGIALSGAPDDTASDDGPTEVTEAANRLRDRVLPFATDARSWGACVREQAEHVDPGSDWFFDPGTCGEPPDPEVYGLPPVADDLEDHVDATTDAIRDRLECIKELLGHLEAGKPGTWIPVDLDRCRLPVVVATPVTNLPDEIRTEVEAVLDEVEDLIEEIDQIVDGVADLPDIGTSDLPDLTIPDVSIPEITIPEITIPDVTIPDITIPDGHYPRDNDSRPG